MINFFNKLFNKNTSEDILDDILEIKINSQEKILFKKYAKLNGTDISKLIRNLLIEEIDNFIKINV
ncbi:MAG: hypothetical protein KIB43_07635 [Clostridium baratii]|uniref:Uncharacterized protein n=1 Tax=Clostridium baratii str. Sullivan TaxID=1415775 RepID=A0A0A7FUN7_9CLOT|nr:DUF6290 family protein [Clostridium baratii]AIY82670.1 hypothetical protein U729_2722 [Clostridium baratii str. Sullivan]MBS6006818.1 hypothetical protein [Clostridium baratii]MDU1053509.1 DUF6290 family protein [Clostridium baratii]MDU4910448.1 DUF6290 family protein [Clostridium baratii]CUP02438.1 Uncharacterised protein [Clostridium baratii]